MIVPYNDGWNARIWLLLRVRFCRASTRSGIFGFDLVPQEKVSCIFNWASVLPLWNKTYTFKQGYMVVTDMYRKNLLWGGCSVLRENINQNLFSTLRKNFFYFVFKKTQFLRLFKIIDNLTQPKKKFLVFFHKTLFFHFFSLCL